MAKCAKCNKLVNRKSPGLQCGKCNKWMHSSCASISNDQLAALYTTEAADWKCRGCIGSAKQKRISVILPDEDEDNTDTDSVTPGPGPILDANSQKILTTVLATIRREIKDTIQEELKKTLQFYSDKIDDYQNTMDKCEEKIKTMENQYKDLNNKYLHMKNNYEAFYIKLNSIEQNKLENTLEICGIPREEGENLIEKTNKIGEIIKQDSADVVKVFRKEYKAPAARKRNSSTVVVQLREGRRDQWLDAAKTSTITPRHIGQDGDGRIYLREALTPATAYLLWKTKSELKDTNIVQFVWCKRGNILIRKSEKDKIHIVRSENDVEKWVTSMRKDSEV